MHWTLHGRVAGEATAFDCDGDSIRTSSKDGWQPPEGSIGWTVPGERGARLTFELVGEGPTFDLLVRGGDRRVTIAELHVTHTIATWLETMDAVCVLTGDIGYTKAERITVLGLAEIRAALASGTPRLDGRDLEHARVLAATHGLDLEADSLKLSASEDGRDLALAWNVPRTNPPESRLKIVSFPLWVDGVALDRAQIAATETFEFHNLWLAGAIVRQRDGIHAIDVVGTTRRRVEFCLAVHSLRSDIALPMAQALRDCDRSQQEFADLPLRNAGSVQALVPLAGADRAFATLETPQRERRLIALALTAPPSWTAVDASPVPYFTTAEPSDAVAPEAPEPTEDADGVSLRAGVVASVALGEADAPPRVAAWVNGGDAEGAALQTWLGRSEAEWTLYLLAQRDVIVDWRAI